MFSSTLESQDAHLSLPKALYSPGGPNSFVCPFPICSPPPRLSSLLPHTYKTMLFSPNSAPCFPFAPCFPERSMVQFTFVVSTVIELFSVAFTVK